MSGIPPDKIRVQHAFWRAVKYLKLRPAAILQQAQLPVGLHLNPHQFVSTKQRFAIWRALEELASDSDLWLKFVEATDAAGHQPLFIAACYASNYRDGLNRIIRFKSACTPEQLSLESRGSEIAIHNEWIHATESEPDVSVDVSFAFLVELGRRGTGEHLTPVRVEFARAIAKRETYQRWFGCPIRFGAPRNVLVLKSADLDRPFATHNPELLAILTPALTAALSESHPASTTAEQVKVSLRKFLASGRPDVGKVARDLGVSERTLQRRIKSEGKTFRALVAEARQELGRQLLSQRSIDLDEVACLLGYQDSTSFYRAFRNWEGLTPGAWRARRNRNSLSG